MCLWIERAEEQHTDTHRRGFSRVRCWSVSEKENFSVFSSTCNFNSLTRRFINAPSNYIYRACISLYLFFFSNIGCADFSSSIKKKKFLFFNFFFCVRKKFEKNFFFVRKFFPIKEIFFFQPLRSEKKEKKKKVIEKHSFC